MWAVLLRRTVVVCRRASAVREERLMWTGGTKRVLAGRALATAMAIDLISGLLDLDPCFYAGAQS
jgi:hypothetical protein